MKLKLMLLTIVLGLFIGCYAPVKEKVEIKNQKPLVWITPTKNHCNEGRMKGKTCVAEWSDGNKICRLLDGRLPTIEELSKVITDCGGRMQNHDAQERRMNEEHVFYQNCFNRKGFTSEIYWSSSKDEELGKDYISYVSFYYGVRDADKKDEMRAIRCVSLN